MTRRPLTLLLVLGLAGLSPAVAPRAAPSPPAALDRPNIVLVLTDDQTYEAVARMPYVSSQQWVSFDRAYVENALCCPSRAAILTGQYDYHNRVVNNATGLLLDERTTLPTWLQAAGYRTALVGKYLNAYPFNRAPYTPAGWTDWHVPYGSGLYQQYNYNLDDNGVLSRRGNAPSDYQVDVLRDTAVRLIESTPATQPLFLYFAPTSTHWPWRAPPRYSTAFGTTAMPHYPNQTERSMAGKPAYLRRLPLLPLSQMDAERRAEWRGSLAVDDAVRGIDAALAATGRASDTVLVFMSDNGYAFGAHRWRTKRCEYEECAHVPLLVRYPGQSARVDHRLVTNVDLASTFAQLAGATPTIPQDGASLVPLVTQTGAAIRTGVLLHWAGGDQLGNPTPDAVPAYWGLRTERYRYVELATGERELYDLAVDPYELRNVVADPAYVQIRSALAAQLAKAKGPDAGRPLVTRIPGQPALNDN